jgi:hypothetical protein
MENIETKIIQECVWAILCKNYLFYWVLDGNSHLNFSSSNYKSVGNPRLVYIFNLRRSSKLADIFGSDCRLPAMTPKP